jgi:chromate reductase, NAD(P)H dehydrogenase (quinone)
MKGIKTLVMIGGISRNSLNRRFFRSIQTLKPEGFDFEVFDITRLPYFSQDIENDPPDIVIEFKEKIRETDALLVITPEYNRSFPGVLKNALDWGSRPYGQNLWDKKPAALMGASIGNIGTFGAQHHLRQVFVYLNVYVLGQPEFYFNASQAFDELGKIASSSTREFIQKYFEAFKDHVELINGSRVLAREERSIKSQGLEDFPSAPL